MYSALVPEWHLDILSASSFPSAPQTPSYHTPAENSSQRALEALTPVSQEAHGHLNEDSNKSQSATCSKKKRVLPKEVVAVPSESVTKEDKITKKRGRPRLHTENETPADRRRRQIRIAQRAYRSRKEATIASLNERVEQLECTVDEMNKTFLAFNDDALKSGVLSAQPELAQRLRSATQRFIKLASEISQDDAPQEDAQSGNAATMEAPNNEQCSLNASGNNPRPDYTEPETLIASYANVPATHATIPICSHIATLPDVWDTSMASNHFFNYKSWCDEESQSPLKSSAFIPRQPSPHHRYTYCFQETSFSRRLHRRCLEFGYSALTDPSFNEERLYRKFKFTFSLAKRDRVAHMFSTLLQRKAGEPLEFWNKPFFYIGKAGMHYPYQDEFGNVIFPPNMHPPERAFGPLPFHNAERPHQFKSLDELIEAIGFGGDWFDCHDVEGYLLEKGIKLSSLSSYVLVPPSAIAARISNASSPSTNSSIGSQVTAASPCSATLDDPASQAGFATAANNPISQTYYPFQNEVCSQMMHLLGLDYDPSLRSNGPPQQTISPSFDSTPSLILDVDKFVTQLSRRGVCLGRAPGFRKHDVDAALQAAVSDVSDFIH
ncbi:uncharacterized protein CIMG_07712 [Coccidioides immitis RS]|uniref:BZIP domain-containing protein n=3 Tax=Coccidioides immitis TaxID=5501 RepID=J3K3Y7_COCIM|nr:uncharacterized protein CIMG_07712 [Coccidioides immitis RS]EAS28966.3 hypothetical protein CIMG_07712 [Coccidioides immitis RS]